VVALVALSAAYRLALTYRLGVGYDEVFVVAVGLLDMEASTTALAVETPMTRSSGTAPLWWWVEYAVYRAAGEISLTALRAAPVALGLAALPLGWALVRRRFGRRVAGVFVVLLACSDVLAFLNSRSDFFESLMIVFILPVVASVGSRQRGWLRGLMWAGLALTFLGKAIFVIGLCGLAELATWALSPRGRTARIKALVVSTVVAAVPVLAWLLIANAHFADRPIVHEATTAQDVWSLLASLTLDYQKTKAHVTGTWRDAMQVWLDGRVWPWNVLLIVPAVTSIACAAHGAMRAIRRRPAAAASSAGSATSKAASEPRASARADFPKKLRPPTLQDVTGAASRAARGASGDTTRGWTRRREAALALAVWVVVGTIVITARGTAGARFHVLYLPALWLLIALAISSRTARRNVLTAPWHVAAGVIPAATLAWISWSERTWSVATFAVWAIILGGVAWTVASTPVCFRHSSVRGKPKPPGSGTRASASSLTPALPYSLTPSTRSGTAAGGIGATALAGCVMGLALWTGPLRWAPYAEFEPMYGTSSLATLDDLSSGRAASAAPRRETVYLLLAHYFYSQHASGATLKHVRRPLDVAERFARLATIDRPHDETGWFYLGLVYDAQGRSADERREVWRKALELKPDSEKIRERLEAVN